MNAEVGSPIGVAVNSASLFQPLTGIGHYTLNLTRAMEATQRVRMNYFYGFEWSDVGAPRHLKNLSLVKRLVKSILPRPYELRQRAQQTPFSAGVAKRKIDLYHEPNYLPFAFDGPTVITVHDLSFVRYPETHPADRVRIMDKRLPPALERAAHIVADSEYTRQEVIAHYGVAPSRITTTLLGVSDRFKPRPQSACQALLDARDLAYKGYWLAVGTLEPRKNLALALRAFSRMDPAFRRRWPLVVVGAKGWKTEALDGELKALIAEGTVRLLGYVSDDELARIYSAASLLVYPSLYEGFGLPIAEAMASGVPVITSDQSCLPEVAGGAGLIVGAQDVAGLREAIERVLHDQALAERMRVAGLQRATQLTWDACAHATLAVYDKVLGR